MPLPAAAVSRTRIHTRRLLLEGWRREHGLWDIEARLTDIQDHDFPLASGVRSKDETARDQCHALASTSETVRRYSPRWFRSNKTGTKD